MSRVPCMPAAVARRGGWRRIGRRGRLRGEVDREPPATTNASAATGAHTSRRVSARR